MLEHGQIKTTLVRAKEMRKDFDKMITLAKKGDLHAKRQALKFVKSKEAFQKLFDEYGSLYENRSGGYTRIFRIQNRLGDNAKMALIQMVDLSLIDEDAVEADDSKDATLTEVKEELSSDEK